MHRIYISSDHGGFELKEHLKKYLKGLGNDVLDYGCHSEEAVDYADFAFLVADAVSKDKNSYGIVIDGVGIASAMVANKVPGIRCAVCWDLFSARNSREHNNANMLSLGGRVLGKGLAEAIVKLWLETPFAGGRHERRVNKIMEVESRFLKR